MEPDDPRHGTNAGHLAHAKDGEQSCEPCRQAATRTRKLRDLATLAGKPLQCELGERAWQIVTELPRNELAAATGMSSSQLRRYRERGPKATVRRSSRDRILAAAATTAPATPIGIQRRLQALSVAGWSMMVVSKMSGVGRDSLHDLRGCATRQFVRAHVSRAIVEVYDRLEMQVPPRNRSSSETRNHALSQGWAPALAWDDIDDPTEHPTEVLLDQPLTQWVSRQNSSTTVVDTVKIDRILGGEWKLPANPVERVTVIRQWQAKLAAAVAAGTRSGARTHSDKDGSLNQLEKLTGWNVRRDLREHGHKVAGAAHYAA